MVRLQNSGQNLSPGKVKNKNAIKPKCSGVGASADGITENVTIQRLPMVNVRIILICMFTAGAFTMLLLSLGAETITVLLHAGEGQRRDGPFAGPDLAWLLFGPDKPAGPAKVEQAPNTAPAPAEIVRIRHPR
jgi:hypothetical protein